MPIALLVVIFTWLIYVTFLWYLIKPSWYCDMSDCWALCIVVMATGNTIHVLLICWLLETILVSKLNEGPGASSKIYLALWNDNHISKWFEHCLYRSFRQRTRSLVLTQLMRFVVVGYFVRFNKLMLKFGILWVSSSAKLVPVGFERVEANSSPETVQVTRDLIDFSLESVSCSNGNTCLVCIGGRHRTSGHIGRRVEWSPALHPP